MESDRINFYRERDAYGYFSNFYAAVIHLKGKDWPTTEHYFQAMKFEGTPREEDVRNADSPGKAATMGRNRSFGMRPDWEAIKYSVMREAVLAKFTQHEDLKRLLLETGDLTIVEHTTNDSVWGDGGDGSGLNWLGKVLMEVREEIRGQ
jgi:ribA/ribD-fused uncharacterized protein